MALAVDEQVRNQRKRDWARDNGWPELADRGRLPAAVDAAFEAFEQATSGGDDGADFTAAAAAMGLSPLDDDSQLDDDPDGGGSAPPPDMPGRADGLPPDQTPAPAGQPQGLPPVRSLDEARQRVGAARPQPAWARPPGGGKGGSGRQGAAEAPRPRGRSRKAQPPPPDTAAAIEVTPKVLDDMAGKLAMLVAVPGKWWQRIDPVCGGAFSEQSPDIIDALIPVMARSQAVVRMFMIDALFFQLFALVTAMWPVADAIYNHHYSEQAQKQKAADRRAAAEAQTDGDDLAMYPSAPVIVTGHTPAYRPPQAQM